MIKKLFVLETDNTYPYKNLAIEEYLTMNTPKDECVLFLWQNKKTVVIGRNQNAYAECDTESLEGDGGYLVRRLSGGGAVFHDLGNLNFTFCLNSDDYDTARQSEVILQAVKSLGIKAEKTGRNDLTYKGRKFSGHAFFRRGKHCYHHGTILMDTDPCLMSKYLTPDKDKLLSKGVKSVKSRILNLSELIPGISREILSKALKDSFSRTYDCAVNVMSVEALPAHAIEKGEGRFASREFIYGKNVTFTHRLKKRFDWGNAELMLDVKDGVIADARMYSDSMIPELPEIVGNMLRGCRYGKNAAKALHREPGRDYTDSFYEADIAVILDDIGRMLYEKM